MTFTSFQIETGLIDNIYSDQTIRNGADHSPTILHFKMFVCHILNRQIMFKNIRLFKHADFVFHELK